MENNTALLEMIRGSMQLSLGCTEPVAIALNVATARRHAEGEVRSLALRLDEGLYKNASRVGIPGADERGIPLCAALGALAGDPDAGLQVLAAVTPQSLEQAKVLRDHVTVDVVSGQAELYIETTLTTDHDKVRVVTFGSHDNIIDIQHAPFQPTEQHSRTETDHAIQRYTLRDFVRFSEEVELEELDFFDEAIRVNRAAAETGFAFGLGATMVKMMGSTKPAAPADYVQLYTASASFARMSGADVTVMTATGSGNQGITLILTVSAACEALGKSREETLRALALASLVNIYGKSFIGTLSPACAVGISSGVGAAVAICHMMGGGEVQMLGAMRNMLGSVTGMLCDGAKEGCSGKVGLAARLAVDSAMLSLHGQSIPAENGILSEDFRGLFQNLSHVVNQGMEKTNAAIISILDEPPCEKAL